MPRTAASYVHFPLLGAALLLLSAQAAADTIVLKNGRRIAALRAFEEGDKVKYMTSAGELSLPKSIVDHSEKGGLVTAAVPGDATANLTIAPPEIRPARGSGIEEIQRGATHDGSIDRPYIAKLESEARSGNSIDPSCVARSEEHTSELQSHSDLVCRLLLEKKKTQRRTRRSASKQ